MSTGLLSQLRSFYESVDENQAPIRPEEVSALLERMRNYSSLEVPMGDGHVRPLGPFLAGLGVRRGRVLAAFAAAAVLIVMVPVLWLAGWTEPGSEPAASPSVVAPASSYRWSRISPETAELGGEFHQWMSDVAVGGPGLVAVGEVGLEGNEQRHAAVWTSPDGIAWSRVPQSEVFVGGQMNSVTAGGPGLVAVGSAVSGSHGAAAVWTSVDGVAWTRVPHDEAVFGEVAAGPATMSSVTVGGPGLVAVGWVDSGQGAASNAVVWTSPDGITWSRVPHSEEVFGTSAVGRCCTSMNSVTAGGPGLVAVGADWLEDEGVGNAVVWTSVDGIAWSRLPHDEATFGDGWMSSVTAGGPGLVAVGASSPWDDESIPAVWTSVDGIAWIRVPHDEAVFGAGDGPAGFGGTDMTSVTSGGPGLVAVGSVFTKNDELPYRGWVTVAVVWTSSDGREWSRVPHDDAVFEAKDRPELLMSSVTFRGTDLVAVGVSTVHDFWAAHNDSGESDAVVWVGVPRE